MTIQPVILAGGSGTRLWPASRQAHPKQLLALTGPYSFLMETARRLQRFAAAATFAAGLGAATAQVADPTVPDPIVVTNEDYRFMVADQLREVGIDNPRIVLEPVGRNTAPAMIVAALLLDPGAATDGANRKAADPVLLIAPSDHLIQSVPAFLTAVAEGAAQAEAGMLVTFGIVPDSPETGYGYIRVGPPAPDAPTARFLAGFTEKPDAATAEHYLETGDYLWNSGIVMTKRSVWLAALERYRPDILAACRAAVAGQKTDGLFVRLDRAAFGACPSESTDYAVLEKLDPGEAVVVPLDVGWSDIGAWEALWTVLEKDESGNASRGDVILEDTRGTLVQAHSRLVTVLGADDLVVVETADAVLVAPKNRTADLKKLVTRVQGVHPELTIHHRQVHRPWGRFDSIDSGERFQVKRVVVSPGASLSLQLHKQRAEHWVVVRGIAEVTCGDKVFRLGEDESTYVPINTPSPLAQPRHRAAGDHRSAVG